MTSVETEYPTATAKARFVHVSASKARRVIDLVRGKSVSEALDILRWAPQAASEPVAKVIASAVANAQNNEGLDPSTLIVATVYADEGPTAKRIRPRAQGRAFRIRKRTSHITVIVESRASREERGGRAPASGSRARRAQGSKAAAAKKAPATKATVEAEPPRRRLDHRRPNRRPPRRLPPRKPPPRRHQRRQRQRLRPRRPPLKGSRQEGF